MGKLNIQSSNLVPIYIYIVIQNLGNIYLWLIYRFWKKHIQLQDQDGIKKEHFPMWVKCRCRRRCLQMEALLGMCVIVNVIQSVLSTLMRICSTPAVTNSQSHCLVPLAFSIQTQSQSASSPFHHLVHFQPYFAGVDDDDIPLRLHYMVPSFNFPSIEKQAKF